MSNNTEARSVRFANSATPSQSCVTRVNQQTYNMPPGRFPMRKAFNELRYRWDSIVATKDRKLTDLAECSFASNPLVTHGAWRGHTFASAAMYCFYKTHVQSFMDEIET
jgi:hypothetical protein